MSKRDFYCFIHATDFHISASEDNTKNELFDHFLKEDISIIKPDLVVTTGDITDSIGPSKLGEQVVDEWKIYSETLKEYGYFTSDKWLDVRGNHDCRDVRPLGVDYSKSHSVFGYEGIDANRPPLRYFCGWLTKDILDHLELVLQNGTYYTYNVLFCHYPLFTMNLSTKSTSGYTLPQLLLHYPCQLYLCGHIHQLLGNNLSCIHSYNLLEQELVDFQYHKMFRVYTIYNDILSSTDMSIYMKGPIFAILSPPDCHKNINYIHKHLRNVFEADISETKGRISIDITIYLFTNLELKEIIVYIDDTIATFISPLNKNNNNIYQHSFTPLTIDNKTHKLKIKVVDRMGESNEQSRIISYKNKYIKPKTTFQSILLKTNFGSFIPLFSSITNCILFLLLICSYIYGYFIEFNGEYLKNILNPKERYLFLERKYEFLPPISEFICKRWIHFTTQPYIFFSIILYMFALLCLPQRVVQAQNDVLFQYVKAYYSVIYKKYIYCMDTITFVYAEGLLQLGFWLLYLFLFSYPSSQYLTYKISNEAYKSNLYLWICDVVLQPFSSSSLGQFQTETCYIPEGSNSFSYSLPTQSQQNRKPKFSLKVGKENQGRWTKEEHELFLKGLEKFGRDWKKIASCIETRTIVQVRTHAQKYLQKLDSSKKVELFGSKLNLDRVSYDSPTTLDALQSHKDTLPTLSRSYSVDATRDLYKSSAYLNINTTNNIINKNNMNTIPCDNSSENTNSLSPSLSLNDGLSPTSNNINFFSNLNSSFLDQSFSMNTNDFSLQSRFLDDNYQNREEASASETLCSLLSECERDYMTSEDYYYNRHHSSIYEENMPDCFQIDDC
ncbi:hypothetical protein WA158_002907 [Blastocystis sp. Blastoise]